MFLACAGLQNQQQTLGSEAIVPRVLPAEPIQHPVPGVASQFLMEQIQAVSATTFPNWVRQESNSQTACNNRPTQQRIPSQSTHQAKLPDHRQLEDLCITAQQHSAALPTRQVAGVDSVNSSSLEDQCVAPFPDFHLPDMLISNPNLFASGNTLSPHNSLQHHKPGSDSPQLHNNLSWVQHNDALLQCMHNAVLVELTVSDTTANLIAATAAYIAAAGCKETQQAQFSRDSWPQPPLASLAFIGAIQAEQQHVQNYLWQKGMLQQGVVMFYHQSLKHVAAALTSLAVGSQAAQSSAEPKQATLTSSAQQHVSDNRRHLFGQANEAAHQRQDSAEDLHTRNRLNTSILAGRCFLASLVLPSHSSSGLIQPSTLDDQAQACSHACNDSLIAACNKRQEDYMTMLHAAGRPGHNLLRLVEN